jgi:hypothetical protein
LGVFFLYLLLATFLPKLDKFFQYFLFSTNFTVFCSGIFFIFVRLNFFNNSKTLTNFDLNLQYNVLKLKNVYIYFNFLKINLIKMHIYFMDYKFYKVIMFLKFIFIKIKVLF